ncbi:hypothetical protein PIB30_067971 [Stylosanthes scabra]|uniref:Uncharacterized protein n=1 Tax=Stylosanthes scabra TaxID=79078 RepID=A0ABU6UM61_9FABA|nr:hypothetical protein [Stylosanthes scabra]
MAVRTYQKDTSLNISEDIFINLNQRGADSEPFAEFTPPGQYLLVPLQQHNNNQNKPPRTILQHYRIRFFSDVKV